MPLSKGSGISLAKCLTACKQCCTVSEMNTTRTADTTRMIASMGTLSARRKIRHYPKLNTRSTFACDGRTVDAIYISADDATYVTCSRCAKLVHEVQS